MIQKLKDQLKETHEELDQSKQELQSKEEQVQAVRQEVSSVWVSTVLYTFFLLYHLCWSFQLREYARIKYTYTCTSIVQILSGKKNLFWYNLMYLVCYIILMSSLNKVRNKLQTTVSLE